MYASNGKRFDGPRLEPEGLACCVRDSMKERTKFEGHQMICTNLPHYPFTGLDHGAEKHRRKRSVNLSFDPEKAST